MGASFSTRNGNALRTSQTCSRCVAPSCTTGAAAPFVRSSASFTDSLKAGLACAFGVQALINMGVAVRLLPAKGMTLPFVSYGGSSMIASGIALGMLLALTRTRPQGEFAEILRRSR